jgi:glyoxylase-like metal-dependent hydrolase (beta-lactamase superfamily II)
MATVVIKIGQAQISRVEELRIPNHIATFTKDQELLAAHRHWLHPHFLDDKGDFDLVFQSWIVEVGGRVVLIDPCNGNGKPHVVPFFNMLDIPYIERMQASGYRPQDVAFVVCTHLHHDHCGWNTQLRAGKWVPTFPKARYIIRLQEYSRLAAGHASLGPADYNRGVFERSVEPVINAGLVDLVSGNHRLTPALTVEPAYGHTFGHQMVHLDSSGRHAFFTGDCFHHPVQLVDPTIPFAGGDDMQQVIAMRRRLVELSADLDACLIAAHVQAPYVVRVSRAGDVYHFQAGA